MELSIAVAASKSLVDGLFNDVQLAATREEHVRLTARLNEAVALMHMLTDIRPT